VWEAETVVWSFLLSIVRCRGGFVVEDVRAATRVPSLLTGARFRMEAAVASSIVTRICDGSSRRGVMIHVVDAKFRPISFAFC
jgi:hypothetical protein